MDEGGRERRGREERMGRRGAVGIEGRRSRRRHKWSGDPSSSVLRKEAEGEEKEKGERLPPSLRPPPVGEERMGSVCVRPLLRRERSK